MRLADPTASPLYRRMVFVLAPPHSAAQEVVRLLATTRGAVAGPGPSRLFEAAVPRLVGNYLLGDLLGDQRFGIAALADEQVFLAAVRRLTDGVYQGTADGRRLVEYSPGHAEQVGILTAVYPDADFVQVVRDPRAVAADAGLRQALPAARRWVAAHRSTVGAFGSGRVNMVKLEHLGDDGIVDNLLLKLELERGADTAGAMRQLEADTVARALPRAVAAAVSLVAGDLLDFYGYPRRQR